MESTLFPGTNFMLFNLWSSAYHIPVGTKRKKKNTGKGEQTGLLHVRLLKLVTLSDQSRLNLYYTFSTEEAEQAGKLSFDLASEPGWSI